MKKVKTVTPVASKKPPEARAKKVIAPKGTKVLGDIAQVIARAATKAAKNFAVVPPLKPAEVKEAVNLAEVNMPALKPAERKRLEARLKELKSPNVKTMPMPKAATPVAPVPAPAPAPKPSAAAAPKKEPADRREAARRAWVTMRNKYPERYGKKAS